MSTGLSIWWATPSDPARHFSDEELQASDRYHRPIRRAGLLATAAKVVLLLLALGLVTGPLADRFPPDIGYWDLLTGRSLLIGAGLTVGALRLPAIAVDAWFEYRFRHGAGPSDGFETVPPARFAVTVSLLAALLFVMVLAVGAAFYAIVARTDAWPAVVVAAVLAVIVGGAALEWPIRKRLPGRPLPLDADHVWLDRLVERFGLVRVPVLVGPVTPGPANAGPQPVARHHFNAASMGLGQNRRIVVSDGLLDEPDAVRDVVVAHELSHLRRHHLAAQTAVASVVAVGSILLIAVVANATSDGSTLAVDVVDPLHMPALAIVLLAVGAVLEPVVAWIGRAQERTADADAIDAVGPLPVAAATRLYAQANTDLDPPWWVRLYAHHPSPAERLEFAERHRRVN